MDGRNEHHPSLVLIENWPQILVTLSFSPIIQALSLSVITCFVTQIMNLDSFWVAGRSCSWRMFWLSYETQKYFFQNFPFNRLWILTLQYISTQDLLTLSQQITMNRENTWIILNIVIMSKTLTWFKMLTTQLPWHSIQIVAVNK